MSVFYLPRSHLYREPQSVDSDSDYAKQEPFDVRAEELRAATVEGKPSVVDGGVFDLPSVHHACRPRISDEERAYGN